MGTDSLPLQVVVLEDDALSRLSIEQLLSRDLRTEVMATFDRPGELLAWLKGRKARQLPHVFVIDAEFESQTSLNDLINTIQNHAGGSSVVLLSQYGGQEVIQLAVEADVAGLLLKREIGLAVATGVYLAQTSGPVFSSGFEPLLEALAFDQRVRRWWQTGRKLQPWRLLPDLSRRQEEIAWHCLIFGMSAQLAAEEMVLTKGTVQKFTTHIYNKIQDFALTWLDLTPIQPIMHRLHRTRPENYEENPYEPLYIGDEWAFHLLTQLPRQDVRLRDVDRLRNPDRVG